MSVKINLGAWNSVFAVPSKVVDEGLKFSDGVKLKVLLYVLRNTDKNIDENAISAATGVNVTDIPEALEYWVNMGLFQKDSNTYSPTQNSLIENSTLNNSSEEINNNSAKENSTSDFVYSSNGSVNKNSNIELYESIKRQTQSETTVESISNQVEEAKKHFAVTKPQKPDYMFTAQQLANDEEFKFLVEEAQYALGKTLSNSDCATLLMLKNTCGLPLDVILMLIHYCISIDKANMRKIEKIGISWADDGIDSVEAAENKIRLNKQLNSCFSTVSSVFGLQNIGSPTKKQLDYSRRWIEDWKFSADMLREAYERCVDKKGTVQFSYIDGILKRWYSNNILNLDDLKAFESKPSRQINSSASKNTSYDINELDKINILGD